VGECVKGDKIPSSDHVALHCPPLAFEVNPDQTYGGLKIDAFRVDDDGVSVDWVEHERGSFGECFEKTCCRIASLRSVRASHRCAIFNVGEIIQTAASSDRDVTVVHDPVEPPNPNPNPAHSLIKGCVPDDDLLSQFRLLANVWEFTPSALKIAKEREKQKRR
jgi:hypothetical protein